MSDFSRAYALSGSNLVSFDPTSPTVGTTIVITGLALGEALVGIDFRPQNGFLYGLGVNTTSSDFGFDFNPIADRIRVTTDTGLNFRINPNNGAPVDGDGGALGIQPDGSINDASLHQQPAECHRYDALYLVCGYRPTVHPESTQ
jgi:Domain of unknown function (DUF4394)